MTRPLRELADATATLCGEPRATHVAGLELRQGAERRARRDGTLQLRVVREREHLKGAGEFGGKRVREGVAVEVELDERREGGEVGGEAAAEGRRGQIAVGCCKEDVTMRKMGKIRTAFAVRDLLMS